MSDEEAVVHAYAANLIGNLEVTGPDDPLLEQLFADPRLGEVREFLQRLEDTGQSMMLPENSLYGFRADEVEVVGDSAVVVGCLVDDVVLLDADGTVIDDDIVAYLERVELERRKSGWVIVNDKFAAQWEGSECGD